VLNESSDPLTIAIINVLDNGCKFSPDHKVIFTLHASETGCTLTCADNGPGIPKDDAAMIFEPFYRGKNTVGVPGHGIGLSLVKRIVSLHGGTITLHNAAGTGTVVSIFLPREAK
jgi:signal transduction histidine kinase